MEPVRFDDLLDIRVGGEGLTMGVGPSRVGRITSEGPWRKRAEALREILPQTLGQARDLLSGHGFVPNEREIAFDFLDRHLRV